MTISEEQAIILFEALVKSDNTELEIMNYEDAKHNCELLKKCGVNCVIEDFINKKFPRVDEIAMYG